MYKRWACVSLLYTLSLRDFLFAASAAPSTREKASTSISTSPDDIFQQQQSAPSTTIPTITLKNSTLTPSNTTATATDPTIIPIPGTGLFLRVTYIGPTLIAYSNLNRLLLSAHESIQQSVVLKPHHRVTPLPWFHQSHDKLWRDTVAIRIRGDGDKSPTWLQLFWVLVALGHFMEGDPMQLHPLNFDVGVAHQGVVAAGVLWYTQSPYRGVDGGDLVES